MKIYHAGNFPLMKDPKKERKMMNHVLNRGYPHYLRLLSFYFKEDIINVMEALDETDNNKREPHQKEVP